MRFPVTESILGTINTRVHHTRELSDQFLVVYGSGWRGGGEGGGDKNMLVKQASITAIREGVMEFFFYGLSIANRNSAASHKTRKVLLLPSK